MGYFTPTLNTVSVLNLKTFQTLQKPKTKPIQKNEITNHDDDLKVVKKDRSDFLKKLGQNEELGILSENRLEAFL